MLNPTHCSGQVVMGSWPCAYVEEASWLVASRNAKEDGTRSGRVAT
jgi:hypothetical protein